MASTSSYRLRASTPASSSSSSVQRKYDVFLSFRGEDTRKKFTDHLYDRLQWRGIKTFRDDPDLPRGTTISPELLATIEKSRFAVVVLSPNYASSTWCLLELAKIVQCMGKRGTILPVFYEVDPSDVRYQRGSFAEAFAQHEEKFGEDSTKVREWREALSKLPDFAGWTSKDSYEAGLVTQIVEELWKEVHPTFAPTEKLVGIDSKLMEIDYLLQTEATDVCFIGIWGMGGIGKTTLAKQVLHHISHHFEVGIFLSDVRQVSAVQGLVHLQELLLFQILKDKNIQVHNVNDGVVKLKRCLFDKKVLLVIDDVDQLDQLENLAGGKDWFGSGSIIIVTTRDQHLLVSHGIEKQYKIKGLNEHEALQFFSWRAFKKNKPIKGYRELSKIILEYARGVPLALKILGSFLWKRDRGDWESTVATLKKAPISHEIFKVLRISYDGLDEICQQVFLDIVCFLKGNEKERVTQILNSVFDFDIHIKINVLVEKSLLTTYDNCVDMHDLIQEMGREVIRLESKEKPWKCSRLWLRDDILRVLKENVETDTIRSIALCLPEVEELAWKKNAFSKMSELKFLKMKNLVLCQGPKYLPDAIRVLEWNSYPSKSLPAKFQPVKLIELILHHSKIEQLWQEKKFLMEKLTHIDLSYSKYLVMTPDFTAIPNLERLVLEGCTNLFYIHPSIVSLKRLKILNLKNCRSIENLPSELEMVSLEIVDLSGCSRVNTFPRFTSQMVKLSELCFGGICIKSSEVSCDLSVGPHHPLSLVLASLKHFCSLKRLHLNDCKLDEEAILDDIGYLSSLEDLDLSHNNFVSLPASISRLSKLKHLNLAHCQRLEQLPCLTLFYGTCHVTVDNCISLKKFPNPPQFCRLWKLSFSFINCSSAEDGCTIYMIYSMLHRFLQEPPPFFEMFSIVIPGNNIPGWFKNRRFGDSARQAPPDCSSCSSQWIGFALCVLVGAEGGLVDDHVHTISCSWKPGLFKPASFSFNLNQVVKSDHLCVFLLPSKFFPKYTSSSDPKFIDFVFEASASLKVKKCGVRTMYKQEVKELGSRMELYNRRMHGRNWIRMVQESPPFYDMFSSVIPGYDIPEWFEIEGKLAAADTVRQERPCISCCENTWMGFALCVLFEADEEPSGVEHRANKIWCCWKAKHFSAASFSCVVSSSDHLCIFFIPGDKFLHLPRWVDFEFKSSDEYLKVKGYGVRSLYQHDYLPSTVPILQASFAEQLLWSIK